MCQFFYFSLENSYCPFWMCTDKNTSLTHRLKPVSVLAVQFSCGSSPITTNVASCMWHAYFVHGVHWFKNMHIAFMATCIQDAGFLISRHATCILQATCMLHAWWLACNMHVLEHWTCNMHTMCYSMLCVMLPMHIMFPVHVAYMSCSSRWLSFLLLPTLV